MIRRLLGRLALTTIAACAGFAAWLAWFAHAPIALRTSPLEFRIPAGSSLSSASRRIAEAGAGFAPWKFTLLARFLGKAGAIRAGTYEMVRGTTPLGLLDKLSRGEVSQAQLAIIEGWTFRQLRTALDAHPSLQHETAQMSEAEVLRRIGASETVAEGLFLPDNYLFDKNSSDLELLQRAYRLMKLTLEREWAERDPRTPYASPYQALIAASIVEKETGVAEDRGLVAAVFANRLRIGMALQSDPTVIYGLGQRFDGNLRKRDLQTDQPYNTYTRPGLPPTPIALPGVASLRATLRPPPSDHLYFVARGDGSSHFSRTLDEHNRAVDRFQRRRGKP